MAIPMPEILVQAALGQAPFTAAPTYTTLPLPERVQIKRGRQRRIGQFETGTAIFEWHNEDRRFDPFHTGGPYGSNIKPGLKIQMLVTYGGTTYYRWTGYVERVFPHWPSPAGARVRVETVDAFKLFERRRFQRGHYAEMVQSFSPLAYFRMQDDDGSTTMKDSGSSGADGTYTGRNKVSSAGAIQAEPSDLALDCGSSAGAAAGTSAHGTSGLGDFGVEMLFKLTALPSAGNDFVLYEWEIAAGVYLAVKVLSSGAIRVTDGTNTYTSSNTVAAGSTWHYVGWFRSNSGGQYRLHVDGVDTTPALVTPVSFTFGNAPHFGETAGGVLRMNGSLDEVAIYAGSVPAAGDAYAHWKEASLPNWAGQRTDQRIWTLLDQMGWPAGHRVLYANGVYTVAGIQGPVTTSYLAHMQDVIRTENGLFYVSTNGYVVFLPEQSLTAPAAAFTFGEGSGELHYDVAPEGDYSDDQIANEIILSSETAGDAYKKDDTSVTTYGWRTHQESGLLFDLTEDMTDRADRLLTQFKDPKKGFRSVRVRGQDGPATVFPAILQYGELGATVDVKRTPVGGGSPISVRSIIDGYTDDITADTWTTTYQLSPW